MILVMGVHYAFQQQPIAHAEITTYGLHSAKGILFQHLRVSGLADTEMHEQILFSIKHFIPWATCCNQGIPLVAGPPATDRP
jgi:hypothetical protein